MKNQFLIAALAITAIATTASADLVAGWSMTTAVPNATTGIAYNYGAADAGSNAAGSMLSGSHVAAATTWSPSGNGSTYSLSSNNWTIGDFYQVSFNTLGSTSNSISWDQTRSGTGPSTFNALMSVDGGANWTTILAGYAVVQAGLTGSGTTSWNTVTNQPGFFTQTVALGAGADNQASVLVRFATTVTTAAAGTNRVDNINVTNTIPAPGAIALISLAGLVARRRR
ncbi:MAG: hypothetical protein DWH97_12160 [Planctomycetota bacterium]|nr:MAG: hypothetical protein DWH97_12160 [Planctomycetota bacterium]